MMQPPVIGVPWWKGNRGEWYVAGQFLLLLLVALGPRIVPGLPEWPRQFIKATLVVGTVFILSGAVLALWGLRALGKNLTPLPLPKDNSVLIESGPYRIVRHPIYSGLIVASLGWGILVHGWLTVGFAVLLFVLFDFKSRREEQWLLDRFQGYSEYRKRVKKLIPFIY
jgi:protein-S-isoprenylcysteine O-methyltransferase Ste14